MKKVVFLFLVGISLVNCHAQEINKKFLVGTSFGYTHNDLIEINSAGSTVSNYQNYVNSFEVSASVGYFLNPMSIIQIEMGYLSTSRVYEDQNPYGFDYHIAGIFFNSAYKPLKRISDKIWLFADCKAIFQYLNREDINYSFNPITYEYDYSNEQAVQLKYGFAIDPGVIFRLNEVFGIQLDYRLLYVFHSNLIQGADSDVAFDKINALDYGINRNLSGLSLGFIAVF